jgi:hypothetical protein
MNSGFYKGILTVATLVLALSGMAWAAADDNGCSNATLTGDYGFRVVGQTLHADGTTSVTAVVGMQHFDGAGNLTQVDFQVTDGTPQPGEGDSTTGFHFRTGQTGTYTVNPDCTGSMEIHLVPPGIPGGVIKIMFVLSNHGHAIHEVVAEVTPPGTTTPVLRTTYADDWKLGTVGDHEECDHEGRDGHHR